MTYARDNSTHDGNFCFVCRIDREQGLLVVFVDVIVDTLHRSRVDTRCR